MHEVILAWMGHRLVWVLSKLGPGVRDGVLRTSARVLFMHEELI
jgi:hypothetical protein